MGANAKKEIEGSRMMTSFCSSSLGSLCSFAVKVFSGASRLENLGEWAVALLLVSGMPTQSRTGA